MKGKSQEVGCTQHLIPTWEAHSKQVVGYVAPINYVNEVYITSHIVQKWLDKGYSEYTIGLLYNGGEAKEKKGTNKFGVKYDTKAYATQLVALLK